MLAITRRELLGSAQVILNTSGMWGFAGAQERAWRQAHATGEAGVIACLAHLYAHTRRQRSLLWIVAGHGSLPQNARDVCQQIAHI
jgi:hypothetical protein